MDGSKKMRPIMIILLVLGSVAFAGEEGADPRVASKEKVNALIEALASEAWEEREKATQSLCRIGDPALPALRAALLSDDPEVRMRARYCIASIEFVAGFDILEYRGGSGRNLRAFGGGRHTESAVLMGLIWLKNHQNPDGMWSCKKFMMNCKKGTCTGAGSNDEYDMGVTALAMLAFLGAGHTHKHGKFKNTVKKGLKAMKERQTPDGCFGPKTGDGHWIYNHAICTQAMVEAYNQGDKSPLLKGPAQKAASFLAECRNPGAGWRYGRRPGASDTSCTAWAVAALKMAQLSGLKVPRESFKEYPPCWDKSGKTIDLVYWYWGTMAMFQLGGAYWKAWNEPMKNMLVPTQKREGCENGSWDPAGAWGKAGGRVFATAINTLTLEVYYRYKRILDVR